MQEGFVDLTLFAGAVDLVNETLELFYFVGDFVGDAGEHLELELQPRHFLFFSFLI